MDVNQLLKNLELLPKKQFGQNFLVDESVLGDIVEAANIAAHDTIVEIGPGLGALTFALAKRAKRVIAIEADYDLATYLRPRVPKNVDIIAGDALRTDWDVTIEGEYKIVANIPYSITSPLLRKIFLMEHRPTTVVLLVQKELAERITATPGKSERGMLTLLTEAAASAEIVRTVPASAFYPVPKVESAVIRLTPSPTDRMADIFWPAVEAGFRHKRQTLANSLKDIQVTKEQSETMLKEIGLDPMARPQVLGFDDWKKLSQLLVKSRGKS
jgi:16S rRNA (adenine1518-N6/adenine1519-N6)-dimethyltransferase